MLYEQFLYLRPPRAETAMEAKYLAGVNESEYFAQPKYNGSCTSLFLKGREHHRLFNRHGEELTLQRPLNYLDLNDSADKWMVLCGEYMNKGKKGEDGNLFNHKFIIWDILVHQGVYLLGTTVDARILLLQELFGTSRAKVTGKDLTIYDHLIITEHPNIFLAPTYSANFQDVYNSVVPTDAYEGIVVKRRDAKLGMGLNEKNNAGWQFKVRKPTKNYNF